MNDFFLFVGSLLTVLGILLRVNGVMVVIPGIRIPIWIGLTFLGASIHCTRSGVQRELRKLFWILAGLLWQSRVFATLVFGITAMWLAMDFLLDRSIHPASVGCCTASGFLTAWRFQWIQALGMVVSAALVRLFNGLRGIGFWLYLVLLFLLPLGWRVGRQHRDQPETKPQRGE